MIKLTWSGKYDVKGKKRPDGKLPLRSKLAETRNATWRNQNQRLPGKALLLYRQAAGRCKTKPSGLTTSSGNRLFASTVLPK